MRLSALHKDQLHFYSLCVCFLEVIGCERQALYFNACHGFVVCFWERSLFFCNVVSRLLSKDYFYGGRCNSSHYYIDPLFLSLKQPVYLASAA